MSYFYTYIYNYFFKYSGPCGVLDKAHILKLV